jgi:hypothetical protein
MKKVVIDKNNLVISNGIDIYKENYNNENLIKVIVNEDTCGFYYIRDTDDNNYKILEIESLPEDYQNFKYFYINDNFNLNLNYDQ